MELRYAARKIRTAKYYKIICGVEVEDKGWCCAKVNPVLLGRPGHLTPDLKLRDPIELQI